MKVNLILVNRELASENNDPEAVFKNAFRAFFKDEEGNIPAEEMRFDSEDGQVLCIVQVQKIGFYH